MKRRNLSILLITALLAGSVSVMAGCGAKDSASEAPA